MAIANKLTTVKYKPHLLNCDKPFSYTPKVMEPIKAAVCLILFQNFLAIENHSSAPYKSRLDFFKGEAKHPSTTRMVTDTNHHLLMPPESDTDLTLSELNSVIEKWILKNKIELKVSYLPQVPCAAFSFPAKSEEEAVEIRTMLIEYDTYLFEKCEEMRVDFANMVFIEMLEDGEWVSWYKENGDDYFEEEDIDDYIQSQKVG